VSSTYLVVVQLTEMNSSKTNFDVVVVGAGFAGMYLLIKLRALGLRTCVIEKAEDVGGTWYWNRYPGARCDIESVQYSYSFDEALQQEWDWSERYAGQQEILCYANHVADRYELRKDIRFGTTVEQLLYQEEQSNWSVVTRHGDNEPSYLQARFCILATGCLSQPSYPDFPGLDSFNGSVYHTADWPRQEVDFSGQSVAIIGTGSSGIQTSVEIAKQAEHLFVLQRTPNYVVPAANHKLTAEQLGEIKQNYPELRAQAKLARNGVAQKIVKHSALSVSQQTRDDDFWQRWNQGGLTFAGVFGDLLLNADANETAAEFVRQRIRDIVHDEQTASALSPQSTFACKRLCVSSHYYEMFNRNNVSLIDISEQGIEMISEQGLSLGNQDLEVDSIVFATGFDAMTGAISKMEIVGREDLSLKQKWQNGPQTYLGLMVAGFPNLFTVTGPGSPSVLSNVLGSIEFHVDYISDCLEAVVTQGKYHIETTLEAEQAWANEVASVVDKTLYRTCNSWYLGSNISDKPRLFMPYPGVPTYTARCREIQSDNFTGFNFS
jgi:cation diffusion facilitator CzcD-associated flavoprotein CzcO